jgi:hypothetical protein
MSTTDTDQKPDPKTYGALDHVIRDAKELNARIQYWQAQGFHVLTPATQLVVFQQGFGVIPSVVHIRTAQEHKEVYYDKTLMKGDERALTRIGLERIEQLAGLSWLPHSKRTSDPSIRNFWEYESWAGIVGYDGQPRMVKGTAEVDLRDESAQIGEWTKEAWEALLAKNGDEMAKGARREELDWNIGGWSHARLLQARRFGLRLAETKSQSACIRNAFGLKHSYTLDELAKPFIVLKVTYLPNAENADELRRMALYGAALLSGGPIAQPRALPAATPAMVDVIETQAVREAVPVRTSQPAPSTTTTPTEEGTWQPSASADTSKTNTASTAPATSQDASAPDSSTTTTPTTKTTSTTEVPVLPHGACYITGYREDPPREKADKSGTYVKAHIETSDGRRLTCVYGKWRQALREARDRGHMLVVIDKKAAYGDTREVARVEDVGAPQDVPLPMEVSL